jgi:acyl-coenzyme A thioesterase PaaI-like protein
VARRIPLFAPVTTTSRPLITHLRLGEATRRSGWVGSPPVRVTGPSAGLEPPGSARPAERHPASAPAGAPIGSHYAHCFGCGDAQPGGLHLSAVAGEGVRVSAAFTVGEAHQGAPGLAHGGVLAAAFDEALGMLLWLLVTPAVTRRLETDFLHPVPVGSTLHIDAWCTGVAGRKIYSQAEGRLGGPDGPVAVRAAALFVRVPLTHFTTHGWGAGEPSAHNP